MKAREGVEGKTEMIRSLIYGGGRWLKASIECEGVDSDNYIYPSTTITLTD